ncbi:MAG: energy transducer TonB [Acidobacteriota bacterium]
MSRRFATLPLHLLLLSLTLPVAAEANTSTDAVDTRFTLIIGYPDKEAAGEDALVVPGAVIPITRGGAIHDFQDEAARSRALTEVGDRLASTFRLASYEVVYAIDRPVRAGILENLPGPAKDSNVSVQAKLLGSSTDAASYEVGFFERSAEVTSNRLIITRGQRAVVGGLNGDEAPYYFLVVEPVDQPERYRTVGEGMVRPKVIHKTYPGLTEEAKAAGIEGIVIVRAYIDQTGVVTGVDVLKGMPYGLTEAARSAVLNWTFEPATLDGQPTAVHYHLTFNFRQPKED